MADDRTAVLPIADDPMGLTAEYLAVAELGGSAATDKNDVVYLAAALSSTVIKACPTTSDLPSRSLTLHLHIPWPTACRSLFIFTTLFHAHQGSTPGVCHPLTFHALAPCSPGYIPG